ncbi:MAG TPA: TIGR03619 family F420-dependent LLM class oxidoreductase [Acidimicrobiales bacterium]|nr:TIGR03619 family F420-dependent LLM class oxidoreductase [Acidimicrobiales bacterium]
MPSASASAGANLVLRLRSYSPAPRHDWSALVDVAVAADQAGVDRVLVSDHVVLGEHLDQYGRREVGGMTGGRQPTGPDGHWLEPMTLLALLAGRTARVRLGTGILLAALRRPVVLAKAAATLDVLSGGRLDLGVGVGWQREEYDAAGLPFEDRGRLLDECLTVCQTLWRDSPAFNSSRTLSFGPVHSLPQPTRAEGVPIWVSGTLNPRVLERIVRFAAGWMPWGDEMADPAAAVPRLREAVAARGRDPLELRVLGHLRLRGDEGGRIDLARTMEPVARQVEAGITDFLLGGRVPDSPQESADVLPGVVEAFREATSGA